LKRFLALCIFVAALLAGSIYSLPRLISSHAVTAELIDRIEQYTGGTVLYEGIPRLGVNGGLSLSLSKFRILADNPDDNFVTTENLTVRLSVLPMLFGNVSAKAFELENPVLRLTQGANGQDTIFPKGGLLGQAYRATREDAKIPNLPAHALRIKNGQVIVQTDGMSEILENVNGDFKLTGASGKIDFDGSFKWYDEPMSLTLNMKDGLSLFSGGESDLKASGYSGNTLFKFEGTSNLISNLFLEGDLDISGDSLVEFIQLTGLRPGDTVFAGGFGVKGQASGTLSNFEIKDAVISVADNTGRGVMQLTSSADSLRRLSGTLAFDRLDLTRLSRSRVDPREENQEHSLNIDFRLSARNMSVGFAELKNVAAAVTSDYEGWVFDVGASEYAGGQLTARTGERLSGDKNQAFLDLNGKALNGVEISNLIPGPLSMTGNVDITSSLRTKQPYPAFSKEGIDGTIQLTATGGTLEGIDMNALFASDLGNTAPLIWQGTTAFNELLLNVFLNKTNASVSKGKINTPTNIFTLIGDVDFETKTIALQTQTKVSEDEPTTKRIHIEGQMQSPTLRLGAAQSQTSPASIQMLNQAPTLTKEQTGISN